MRWQIVELVATLGADTGFQLEDGHVWPTPDEALDFPYRDGAAADGTYGADVDRLFFLL